MKKKHSLRAPTFCLNKHIEIEVSVVEHRMLWAHSVKTNPCFR